MRLAETWWVRRRSGVGSGPTGETGAALLQYGLIVALIAVACLAAVAYVGGWANLTLESINDLL